ncbi:MAG: Fe-S cluster domain-containing protein [Elusimicrobiota bacterium]|nr:Fe-S cluster domain-containing protein [Elusimicrobiota bacterium]
MNFIIIPVIVLGLLGLVLGVGLAIASKKFAVKIDPRVDIILGMLPGANCAACGFAGCLGYAKAIIDTGVKPSLCTVGGDESAQKIAELLGVETASQQKMVARIHCGGDISEKRQRGNYDGVKTCVSATLVSGGTVMCSYGCLGFSDCVRACLFDAMKSRENLPPEIDEEKCTFCGLCVKACPRNLIELIPKEKRFLIACSSFDKGKIVRLVCDVGCIACMLCVKKCPCHEKVIVVENNLAKINYTTCENAGECFKACPTKCIQWKR